MTEETETNGHLSPVSEEDTETGTTYVSDFTFSPGEDTTAVNSDDEEEIDIMANNLKIAITKFGGLPAENAEQFLQDFESYAILNKLKDCDARKIAAFHLHLTGPCLIWYQNLSEIEKGSWETLKSLFNTKYVNLDIEHNPALFAESELFSKIQLAPTQAIDAYHSVLLQKGKRLQKPDRDILIKFIEGLPAQLAFFVRAGCPANLSDALQASKMGEAYGYRVQTMSPLLASNHAELPTVPYETSVNQLATQVSQLTQAVDKLTTQKTSQYNNGQRGRGRGRGGQQTRGRGGQQAAQPGQVTCYQCQGLNHYRNECNQVQDAPSKPDTQCQLCEQYGHDAPYCRQLQQQGK